MKLQTEKKPLIDPACSGYILKFVSRKTDKEREREREGKEEII